MNYIKEFHEIELSDIAQVGGKNASLGQMIRELSDKGVPIPDGFAITAQGYWHYIDHNNLRKELQTIRAQLSDVADTQQLEAVAQRMRSCVENAAMPADMVEEITQAYAALSKKYGSSEVTVAVRSSATAEDLPEASFAGQQESYLSIHGVTSLLEHCKKCFASLFTARAIAYRALHNIDDMQVALSIGVQKMVNAESASAGVAFSLDTETGFANVVIINAVYGFGESLVQGEATPDEYVVYKKALEKNVTAIIKKERGNSKQPRFCLSDAEILTLAHMVVTIESYYSELKKQWCPMDVEWAKDSDDGTIYIVQARPETVHVRQQKKQLQTMYIDDSDRKKAKVLCEGQSIGTKIAHGTARVMSSISGLEAIRDGDIIVTDMTDPAWVPAMKRCAGIVTNRGGRTCHAAIVCRELGLPAVIGCNDATTKLSTGQQITLDCSRGSRGYVYEGSLPIKTAELSLDALPHVPTPIMVNCADPDQSFSLAQLPVEGVGLARIEFIIANQIDVHPMALVHPEKVTDVAVMEKIVDLVAPYKDGPTFFIDTLAQGISMIAAAMYPKKVIVRFSDFKSNEYRALLGGSFFEPEEENPMLGLRGASRYCHELYKDAFKLECAAMKKAREIMGFSNIAIMIPFVRSIDELQRVQKEMALHGLVRGEHGLVIIMMVEIPSNIELIDEFSNHVDGYSIGSNDLTQLVLGVDRDSQLLAGEFDERNEAVKHFLKMAVEGAHRNKKTIGICGQAPSDYPEVAQFLIDVGIDYLSLNADAVIPFLLRYKK